MSPRLDIVGNTTGASLLCQMGAAPAVALEASGDLRTWRTGIGLLARDSQIPVDLETGREFFRLRSLDATGALRRLALGDGGAVLDLPAGQHGPYAVAPKVVAGVTAPVPTCSWWSSLVWDFGATRPYGYPLYAWPLGYIVGANGVSLGLPTVKAISTYEYHWEFVYGAAGELPMRVAVDGMTAPEQRVTGWGDWTVSFRLQEDAAALDTQIGMGLPMAWFAGTGGNLSVNPATGAGLQVWRNSGNELGLRLFGVSYLLFGPAGSTWNGTAPFRPTPMGPIALAALPDTNAATLERFRGCTAPQDSRVSWAFDEATAKLTTRYALQVPAGGKAPPVALFPHQWTLSTATATDAYDSPRGRMKLVDGGSFTTETTFPGLLPHLPAPTPDAAFDPNVLNGYLNDVVGATVPGGADTYWSGKAIWRLAALVPIARQAGRNDLAATWLGRVKTALEDWFDGAAPNVFRYDRTWSTAYGLPAGYETNGYIQDHHFHWGYFIQSAALVAREDPAWAARYGAAVELLIRDTANWQRGDATFPFLNSFEPYAGHAWANGPAQFFAGNNQESSSESIHFAAGVFQWGLATARKDIRDLGIFLYTTEVEAIHRYWLNEGGLAFPSGFHWPMLGIVWGNGGAYATWFGGHPDHTVYIHGINFLPITPASLHLGRNPTHFLSTLAPFATNPSEWFDIVTCARATADPDDAAARLAANSGYTPFDGTTKSHTYYWVHALRQLGRPTSITADHPSAVVLQKGSVKSYLVWNPADAPLQTHFSDGHSTTQAPRSLGVTR
jgi:endoglucanase Acf2